jgi:hypothetical protein
MSSVAEITAPDTAPYVLGADDTALDALADRLYMAVGACGGRLAKAVALVRSGAVTVVGPKHALVQSQRDPAVIYDVNGHCSCDDAKCSAEGGRCKHVLSAALSYRLARPGTGCTPQPIPQLPEAPASVNVRLMLPWSGLSDYPA